MPCRALPPLLLAPLLLWLSAPALAAPASPAAPDDAAIDALRDEAQALVLLQSVLGWYTRIGGEPSIQAETYKGHGALLSPDSIRRVASAVERATDPAARRSLQFFRSYLEGELLNQRLSRFDDERENAELGTTVTLPFASGPVPYKQLEVMVADEKDAGRRAAIEQARAVVWREILNPILEKKEAEAQALARSLGYRSYVELASSFRMMDLGALIRESDRFRGATDALYQQLLAEQAHGQLGVAVKALRRADLSRLRKAPALERFYPRELMVPALRHFLAGIGLDMKTVAGTEIRVDDAIHPLKEPRAACFSIRVPSDVRISVKPTGGLGDFVTFFHEGGHALHYANATTARWEFQQLGPYALTEGLAETFGHAWDDPLWLRRYRDFVTAWNREHKTDYPVMSDSDIASQVRARVFDELYMLRRYGSAKLIYEAALHGGEPSLWKGVYKGPVGDLQALYKDLFGRAYGFPLTDEDALRFRTDVDDMFYAADYLRAFGLSNLIHEGLRARFGDDWYGRPEVGQLLRKELFADANRVQPDEVARLFGHPGFSLAPSEARYKRLLGGAAGTVR